MIRYLIALVTLLCFFGCGNNQNPDDGIRLRTELKDVTAGQLEHTKFGKLQMAPNAYSKVLKDTIIIYSFDSNKVERHAMFKYHGDTTSMGFENYFKKMHFTLLKTEIRDGLRVFILEDPKYGKRYMVSLSNMGALDFFSN